MLKLSALAAILVLALTAESVSAAPTASSENGFHFGPVKAFTPEGTPRALVIVYSDAEGWTSSLDEVGHDLAAAGVLAVGVDSSKVVQGLKPGREGCLYAVADVEDTSHTLQRKLGITKYLSPIVAGVGEGGTLAALTIAQSPEATVQGAVAIDRGHQLASSSPFCGRGQATPLAGGAFFYKDAKDLPGFLDDLQSVPTKAVEAQLTEAILAAVDRSAAAQQAALGDLPIAEIPPEGDGTLLAVIISGDGGWRDIDKEIGAALAQKGVGVVGIDSLRYFWNERKPDELAADLQRIIAHYAAAYDRHQVVLVGYSFGADVLPAAMNRLPADLQKSIVQLSLLGLEPTVEWEFHVAGWFGGSSDKAVLVAPEVKKLDPAKVQCFFGAEEDDSFCHDKLFDAAERVPTKGGHHFNGDYAGLAAKILSGAERRLGKSS
ncbi:MAG: AcvB/VirJ family lysyl-phosphatidylglycerol hydrolase [Geminicoccaceae bacterium]